jgi:DNA-binding NtrC family response regulator
VPPLRERGNDILMLFRKFAADYAEKYRTKPVTLDESAKQALLNYHFPGNVRQLKNIADQVSLLENNGTPVSAETIRRYLPDTSPQRFPTVANMDNKNESNIERELLYKMLFDLKKEVGEMRQMLALLIKNSAFPAFVSGETQNNVNIFHEEPNNFQFYENPTFTAPVVKNNNPTIVSPAAVKNEAGIQDITPVVEEEVSLQIDKTEKELIIKALKKNRGKRKYAAADLGISERTLYRKIKQYDLENY